MLSEFENKIADFAKANGLFEPAERVLLAVSGGADSTALMYAMFTLKNEGVFGSELLCAHINHQLRETEAELDEDFVISQARKLKLPVITKRVDVRGFAQRNKLSIETAGRKLRIEALLDIAKKKSCAVIATAHQKNDNAETILQRLIRGTGFRGLGGIWPKRVFADGINFVRPFLCVRRDEIIEYLKEKNLKWRQDHTNVDCSYRRNFIRHRLIPALQQQCNGSIAEQLFDLSGSAQRFYSLVCRETEKVWHKTAEVGSKRVVLNLKNFLTQPQPVKVELVRMCLVYLGSGEKDLTHRHYQKIFQLAQHNVGKKIELPDGLVVQSEYENLIFTRLQKKEYIRPSQLRRSRRRQNTKDRDLSLRLRSGQASVVLQVPGRTQFGSYLIEATILESDKERFEKFKQEKTNLIEWFDVDKVKRPLAVRFRKEGDRFIPLGLKRQKKVGKFLTDEKVPMEIRQKALIVADSEKIIWVWPIRISEQAKITSETKKILQLKITESNQFKPTVFK